MQPVQEDGQTIVTVGRSQNSGPLHRKIAGIFLIRLPPVDKALTADKRPDEVSAKYHRKNAPRIFFSLKLNGARHRSSG